MKLLAISLLFALVPLSLSGEDQPSQWATVARQSQAQFKAGRFAEAAANGKRALQLAKGFGPSDRRVASTYHMLGAIYREWGHCGESRSSYAHAIAIWKRQPEPNSQFIMTAVTNLLSLLAECDEFTVAEKAFRNYQSDLLRYRTDSLDDARVLSIRAALARGRGNYVRAEALFRETIAAMENSPRATPLEIAGERGNLAVAIGKQGRDEESLAESQRVIAFFEKSAPRHPSLVAALNNAACSLANLRRKDEAELMFQRALQAAADLYGEDNRISAKIMLSYAKLLREKKEAPVADAWQKRGAEAYRRALLRDQGTVDAEELKALGK